MVCKRTLNAMIVGLCLLLNPFTLADESSTNTCIPQRHASTTHTIPQRHAQANDSFVAVLAPKDLELLVSEGIITQYAADYITKHHTTTSSPIESANVLPNTAQNNTFKSSPDPRILDYSLGGVALPLPTHDNDETPTNPNHMVLDSNALSVLDAASLPNTITSLTARNKPLSAVHNLYLLSDLKELHLISNQLGNQGLQSMVFPMGLEYLDLSYNNITSLNKVTFPPYLKTLVLSGNPIRSFSGVKWPSTIKNLYLSDNPVMNDDVFSCIPFPANMQKLWADECRLTSLLMVQFHLYHHLVFISLKNNYIRSLEYAKFPAKLTRLALDYNPVDIRLDMFDALLKTCTITYRDGQRAYYKSKQFTLNKVSSLEMLRPIGGPFKVKAQRTLSYINDRSNGGLTVHLTVK